MGFWVVSICSEESEDRECGAGAERQMQLAFRARE